jgi:hypothetical protein
MATGGPIRSHSAETSEGRWNGSRNETNLGDATERTLRRAYAWRDPDGDPSNKTSYKFIHHEVAKDGTVGPANVRAAINGIGVLNGGRGGADIPAGDRKGVYNHLARHLRDADREPADLEP